MRVPALVTLALTISLGIATAQDGVRFVPDSSWPADRAKAPGYGAYAVSAAAVDAKGQVFIFQRGPVPVLVFDQAGRYLRGWGENGFSSPHGCRVDPDGNLWLTDNGDHRVLKYSPEGKLLLTLGVKGEAGDDATHFNKPTDVAFAPNGDVYVSDGYGNSRVARFTRAGKFVSAWGKKGTAPGEFNLPHSIAIDPQGRVYVADRENARLQVFTAEGKFITQWNEVGNPYGLFLTPDQRLIISDGIAHTVSVYDLQGKRLARFGMQGKEFGQLDLPHLLTMDRHGALYVCEVNGKRVQRFKPE
jgi:DNA-binding beta-propeller fold protein YncE